MIAIKRLASIMWILVVAAASLAAYLISLNVANEQKAVNDLQREIYQTRASIRYLEAEFGSRASLGQLERWNADNLKLAVTPREHFLADEKELANLDGIKPNGEAYVAPPVMTAMVSTPADTPAATAKRTESPSAGQVRDDFSLIRSAMANDRVPAPVARKPADAEKVLLSASAPEARRTPSPAARQAARMALLDEKLLDDSALRRLGEGESKRAQERAKAGH